MPVISFEPVNEARALGKDGSLNNLVPVARALAKY